MNENKDFSCLCTLKFLIVNDRIKLFQLITKWKSDQLYNLGTRGQPGFRVGCGPCLVFLSTPCQVSRGDEKHTASVTEFWKTLASISCELQGLLWYKYENQLPMLCAPAISALPALLKLLGTLPSWCPNIPPPLFWILYFIMICFSLTFCCIHSKSNILCHVLLKDEYIHYISPRPFFPFIVVVFEILLCWYV